jgi:uncharacterized protein (DUF2237 family)
MSEAPQEARFEAKNVLGGRLELCCASPTTGFYRTGRCESPRRTPSQGKGVAGSLPSP